jgi:hypothetical protein
MTDGLTAVFWLSLISGTELGVCDFSSVTRVGSVDGMTAATTGLGSDVDCSTSILGAEASATVGVTEDVETGSASTLAGVVALSERKGEPL